MIIIANENTEDRNNYLFVDKHIFICFVMMDTFNQNSHKITIDGNITESQ